MTLTPECRPPTPQQDLTLICFSGDEIVCTRLKDELSEVEQRWREHGVKVNVYSVSPVPHGSQAIDCLLSIFGVSPGGPRAP